MYPTALPRLAASRPRRRVRLRWIRRAAALLAAVALFFAVNWLYQAFRKPTELLAPLPSLAKTPRETWTSYGPLFQQHSTRLVTPELLAALAQVEAAGNPIARTYWRWRWSLNPFELYRPASSAVGMFQLSDAAFQDARRYCVRDHEVVPAGPWYDPRGCWLAGLRSRVVPGDAIELTSAYLHQSVVELLGGAVSRTGRLQRERLAAVVHLCGKQRAEGFRRRGFHPAPGERCGDHALAAYLAKVERARAVFAHLARTS